MGFFRKDRKVFGMTFWVRIMVTVLIIVMLGVSERVVMAGWVDDSSSNPVSIIYTNPSNGNVGIGTTNPQTKVHISGNSGNYYVNGPAGSPLFVQTLGSLDYPMNAYFDAVGTNDNTVRHRYANNGNTVWQINYGSDIIWYSYDTTFNPVLKLKQNGNVGIGTTNPQAKLEINGNIRIGGTNGAGSIKGQNTSGSGLLDLSIVNNTEWTGIQIGSQNAAWGWDRLFRIFTTFQENNTYYYNQIDVGPASINFVTKSESRLYINNSGNIGIGTTNPGDNKLTVAGIIAAQSYRCTSDSRYKTNIALFPNALDKLLGLRGVTFFWNTAKYKDKNFTKEKQIGFVAQEVEKIIPEIVYTDSKGFKTMSYDRLTAVLVEAIKELKGKNDKKDTALDAKYKENEVEIAALKAENKELKKKLAKLDSLEKRLAALEKSDGKQEAMIAEK